MSDVKTRSMWGSPRNSFHGVDSIRVLDICIVDDPGAIDVEKMRMGLSTGRL
jgi:hypothetical protein